MNATLGTAFVALGLSASVAGLLSVAWGLATRNPVFVVRSRAWVALVALAAVGQVAVMERANQQRAPLPVASGAMQPYRMALAKGLGEEAKGAMIKVWERVMGVDLRRGK